MFYIYKVMLWFKQTFLCIHDYKYREYDGYNTYGQCSKCGKFIKG